MALKRQIADDDLKASGHRKIVDTAESGDTCFRKLFDSAPAGLVITDAETNLVFDANPADYRNDRVRKEYHCRFGPHEIFMPA